MNTRARGGKGVFAFAVSARSYSLFYLIRSRISNVREESKLISLFFFFKRPYYCRDRKSRGMILNNCRSRLSLDIFPRYNNYRLF